MEKFNIDNILRVTKIENEFELEIANSLFNKLRLLLKEDPSVRPLRSHLANLIEAYEEKNWLNEDTITEEQESSSERAEKLVRFQNLFIQHRKQLIKKALNDNELIQNDLASILGHRKNYMSELINGIRPFSKNDIVVINRVLGVKYESLIIPVIEELEAQRIRITIKKLNKPKLKLKEEDLNLEFA